MPYIVGILLVSLLWTNFVVVSQNVDNTQSFHNNKDHGNRDVKKAEQQQQQLVTYNILINPGLYVSNRRDLLDLVIRHERAVRRRGGGLINNHNRYTTSFHINADVNYTDTGWAAAHSQQLLWPSAPEAHATSTFHETSSAVELHGHLGLATIQVSEAVASSLLQSNMVWAIEENKPIHAFSSDNDPIIIAQQLDRLDQVDLPLDGASLSPNAKGSGLGVNVYLFDTGFPNDHMELLQTATGGSCWVDPNIPPPTGEPLTNPCYGCHWHGGAVASVLAGATLGVAKSVTLHSYRVLNCNAQGTTSSLIAGLNAALGHVLASNSTSPAGTPVPPTKQNTHIHNHNHIIDY